MEIVIFEEHSSVLPEWKHRNISGRTLVYLDAHLDLQLVGKERMVELKQCETGAQVARLEKPHYLAPDDKFGFSIEDFLYPANRMGLIDKVIWVVPGEKCPDASGVIKRALHTLEGMPLEHLKSLSKKDTHLEASLLGVPVIITSYRNLKHIDIPADTLIDIDIDYFVSKNGALWIDPKEVFQALDALSVQLQFVTICRSVTSGFTPLRYRFVADYLAALFQQDAEAIKHFSHLYQMDKAAIAGDRQGALNWCLEEVARYGQCAATYYLAGLCDADDDKASDYLAQAARLNWLYKPDVVRLACEVINRTRSFDTATVQDMEELIERGGIEKEHLHLAYLVMVMLAVNAGERGRALKYYTLHKKLRGRHPRLSFALGSLLLKAGHPGRAVRFLRDAILDEDTRPHAYLRLGAIYLKEGDFDSARECLGKASEMLPSSPEPVKLLAHLCQRIGDAQGYQQMLSRYRDMMRVLAS